MTILKDLLAAKGKLNEGLDSLEKGAIDLVSASKKVWAKLMLLESLDERVEKLELWAQSQGKKD